MDEGYFSRVNVINNFSAVTAACLLVKKSIYEKVNGLTEKYAVAFNDIDFCLKVRKLNLLVVYTPYAKLYHYESKTRGPEDNKEKLQRFANEIEMFKDDWESVLENKDPYYNMNLSLDSVNFSLNMK